MRQSCFRYIAIMCGFVLISSCNTKQNENNNKASTEPTIKQITSDSAFSTLKRLPESHDEWQKIYTEQDKTFSLDSFNYVSQYSDEFIYSSAKINNDFYKKYGSLIVYNKDKTKFIDPFSYYLTITIDQEGHLHRGGTEADQEIAVVDIKTKKRYRIFFCGTPCFVSKVVWVTDDKIALMGITTEEEDDNYTPTVWLIDLKKGTTTEYNYNKQIKDINPDVLLDNILQQKGIGD